MKKNIYYLIRDKLPKNIRKDLFTNQNFTDNSLTSYHRKVVRFENVYINSFFYYIHRLIILLKSIINLIHRKITRLHYFIIYFRNKRNPVISKNKIFINKHKGKRCFIIANGPSLRLQDLSYLKNELTIVTNTFWKHPILESWQPTYYCTAHTDLFYPRPIRGEGFEDPTDEDVVLYFKNITEKIHNAIYFIPFQGYRGNLKNNFLPKEKTFYTPTLPYPLYEFLPDFPNTIQGFPWVQDSSQYAMLLAMSMGFSQIILLGCDHDWYVNIGEEKHFFDGPAIGTSNKKSDTSKTLMLDNMWFSWVLWRGHKLLREMAEKNGVEIINATGGGILDIYKIKKYEDFFK